MGSWSSGRSYWLQAVGCRGLFRGSVISHEGWLGSGKRWRAKRDLISRAKEALEMPLARPALTHLFTQKEAGKV